MVTAALLPAAEIRAAETWAESAAAGMVPESAEAVSREAKAETEAAPESGAAQEAGAETSPGGGTLAEAEAETVPEGETAQEAEGKTAPESEAGHKGEAAQEAGAETAPEGETAQETGEETAPEGETAAEAESESAAETGHAGIEGEPAAEETAGAEILEEAPVLTNAAEAKGAVNSFVNIGGKKYYFDENGKKLSNRWLKFGEFTYYIGADGAACTGFLKIGGRTYYFKDSRGSTRYPVGAMESGWQKIGGMKFYFADSGYPAIGDKYPGAMLTGFRRIGGNMYYFADTLYPSMSRGRMMDGWRTISGRKYYFGADGIRRTGFQTIDGKTYYFADAGYSEYTVSKQGVMLKALKKIGGKYYFFNEYGVMKTGWISYNGVKGFFLPDGTAASGWRRKGDDWYYLKENGIAHTGWLKLSDSSIFYLERARGGRMVDEPRMMSTGKIYFFDAEGRRATTTGWRNFGKYYYYTYSDGTCAVSTEIDGIRLDENGRTEMTAMDIKAQGYYSSTNYLILVDRSIHKVGIYKGRQGNWVNIRRYSCGDGKPSTPTIEGTFTVGIKLRYFDSGSARCWYATQFCGNYLFHSVLYYQDSYPAEVMDGTLGAGVSHGCVRLEVSNARWIYDNIPRGTKVVVYH